MNTPQTKGLKKLTLVVALLATPLLAWTAYAQVAPEQPIKGTIEVTEGADYQALARITLEEARAAAEATVPGAIYDEGELDEEDGYLVYEFEFKQNRQEIEVTIDAGDGSVLEVEREDEDDD